MEASAAAETTGEKLIRLWQERQQANREISREIREKGYAGSGFGMIRANRRFYSFISGLVGEQVTVSPLEEDDTLAIRRVKLFSSPSKPAKEGRFKYVNCEVTGQIINGSTITDNHLLLRRTSIQPSFRLPKTFEIEILNAQTGEPQVDITVGAD